MQGYPNANFANGRESTQITAFVIPDTSSCHSERSEESHPGKERRFFAYALNDKGSNAEEHPPPVFYPCINPQSE